jgi:hypothetical protein
MKVLLHYIFAHDLDRLNFEGLRFLDPKKWIIVPTIIGYIDEIMRNRFPEIKKLNPK